MVYTLRFFSLKCSLLHNSNLFGSCIIHILYTECAKIKKLIPRQKVNQHNPATVDGVCKLCSADHYKLPITTSILNYIKLYYIILYYIILTYLLHGAESFLRS